MQNYEAMKKAVEDWLESHGVTFEIKLIGDSCPSFCEDKGKDEIGKFPRKTHIHGQHYRLSLHRSLWKPGPQEGPTRTEDLSVDYWNSYAAAELKAIGSYKYRQGYYAFKIYNDAEKERMKVRAANVLGVAQLSNPGSFDDWCQEYGYDNDSIKAQRIYQLCVDQYRDFRRMFTPQELEEISEKVREL